MKFFFILALMAMMSVTSYSQISSATLTASGLTCAMCTRAIYNSLSKLPAVGKVEADIKNSSFNIRFKDGSSVDPDQLKAAVKEAGFSVARLRLTGQFNNVSLDKDAHVMIGGKLYHFLKVDKSVVLNGTSSFNVVDKNFMAARDFRNIENADPHHCLETGKAEACCPKGVASAGTRIYHAAL